MKSWFGKGLAAKLAPKLALLAGLIMLLGQPAAAQVPDPFARQLAQQLARSETILGERGYQRVAGPFAGGMPARLNRRFQLTLRAGQSYEIIGVCDARCRNLDMRVFDANDALVGEDVLTDDVPVVNIRPRFTGLYTVEVTMPQCAASPCFFAFNVYAR